MSEKRTMVGRPNVDVKPCPFCGGSFLVVFSVRGGFYVACYDCFTHGPPKRNRKEAEERWNRRVGDDLMERMEDDGK